MASLLKVDALTGVTTAGSISVTGEGNSTTTNLQQGLCKAWFYMDNDFVIDDSTNMASVTDAGSGKYSHAYTNSMSNSTYVINAGSTSGALNTTFIWVEPTLYTTSGAQASTGTCSSSTNSLSDNGNVTAVHGDLA